MSEMSRDEVNAKIITIMELALKLSPVGVNSAWKTHEPSATVEYGGHCSIFSVRLYSDASNREPDSVYTFFLSCNELTGYNYTNDPEQLDEVIAAMEKMITMKEMRNGVHST